MKIFILISCFLTFNLAFSQVSIEKSDGYLIYFDKSKATTPLLVLKNNSYLYYASFQSKPDTLIYVDSSFSIKKKNFEKYISIKNNHYFVQNGGGILHQLKNDSIIRIDNSFAHKNQFNSRVFSFKNKIYNFGGYGLFTFKNILTKFNFSTREWQEVKTKGKKPSPRANFYSHISDNNLYVYGGYSKSKEIITQHQHVKDQKIWKLDLNKMIWSEVTEFPENLFYSHENIFCQLNVSNRLYLLSKKIIEINFSTKRLKSYTYKNYRSFEDIVYNPTKKTLSYAFINPSNNKVSFDTMYFKSLLGKNVKTIDLEKSYSPYWYTLFLFILIPPIIYFRKNSKKKSKKLITYLKKDERLIYNKQVLSNLSKREQTLLVFLIDKIDSFIALSDINLLFENQSEIASFSTIAKRRDITLSELISKLSFILDVPESDILKRQRSIKDKRVKEIKLNNLYFRTK